MSYFNKETDELFISLVQCSPTLYDASHKDYKNNVFKHKAWENISETMKIPVPDLKKRWKHIRDHFMKKKKAATLTGQARRENTWEYMEQLNFLLQVPSKRTSVTNIRSESFSDTQSSEIECQLENPSESVVFDKDSAAENDNCVLNASTSNNVSESIDADPKDNNSSQNAEKSFAMPAMKKRRKPEGTSLVSLLKNRQSERDRVFESLITDQKKQSAIHKFFESMADTVSEFPPHLVAEARLRVCQVVNELEMKKNSPSASWSAPSQPHYLDLDPNLPSESYTNL